MNRRAVKKGACINNTSLSINLMEETLTSSVLDDVRTDSVAVAEAEGVVVVVELVLVEAEELELVCVLIAELFPDVEGTSEL